MDGRGGRDEGEGRDVERLRKAEEGYRGVWEF